MTKILHTGTVIEGPAEYKSSRMTNRERKQSIVEEILADKKIRDYSKNKFLEIQSEKSRKKSFQSITKVRRNEPMNVYKVCFLQGHEYL